MENNKQAPAAAILGYDVVNAEKWDRAVHGMIGKEGRLWGGVGEEATDAQKIAEYDRIGGLIRKGKSKVKTGSFYDFGGRKPREAPEVTLEFRDIEGNVVEIPEDAPVPLEVRAAEVAQERKAVKNRVKAKRADDSE